MLTLAIPTVTGARRFVVQSPSATAYTPPGCATHGSSAWDITEKKLVYVKDMWRVDLKEFDAEGITYGKLMQKNVPNIAACIASGDVGGRGGMAEADKEADILCNLCTERERR